MRCSSSLVTHYSIKSEDQIFVRGYGCLSFAKNICKNTSKNLIGKYSKKFLDNAKQSVVAALRTTSKNLKTTISIEETAEVIDGLIGNKIAVRITQSSPWST